MSPRGSPLAPLLVLSKRARQGYIKVIPRTAQLFKSMCGAGMMGRGVSPTHQLVSRGKRWTNINGFSTLNSLPNECC